MLPLQCALPLPNDALPICGTCRDEPPAQTATHASLLYLPPLDQLLVRYKFHQDLAAGRLLAQLMQRAPPPWSCAPLVPVPLHRWRLWRRGFNQAALLGGDALLGMNVLKDLKIEQSGSSLVLENDWNRDGG